MMVHPGYVDSDLQTAGGAYVEEREKERELLCNERTKELINELGIQLINYSELYDSIASVDSANL